MDQPIRVLIADDTEIAREGMRRVLAEAEDMAVIGEASTVYEAIRLCREKRPDILLLDLRWSRDDSAGICAIGYLRQEMPEVKIIAITVYDELIGPAREAGAHLAVTKDCTRMQLQANIRELHRATALPPARAQKPSEKPLVEPLTERENEVLLLLAQGMTDRQIADTLVIAENTAKSHVSSILGKLGAQNRTHAVIVGLRLGILNLS